MVQQKPQCKRRRQRMLACCRAHHGDDRSHGAGGDVGGIPRHAARRACAVALHLSGRGQVRDRWLLQSHGI